MTTMTKDQIEAMKILADGPRFLPNTEQGRRAYGGHYIWKDEIRQSAKLAERFMDWQRRTK